MNAAGKCRVGRASGQRRGCIAEEGRLSGEGLREGHFLHIARVSIEGYRRLAADLGKAAELASWESSSPAVWVNTAVGGGA